MTPITVRAATPRDLPRLVSLCDRLNAYLSLETGHLDVRRFRSAIFGVRAFVFADVAQAAPKGGEAALVGYALSHDAFTTDRGERGLYLIDLYVEPPARGAGAGRRLMASVAARAKKRGATHVWWGSMAGAARARRFYARLGAQDDRIHSHFLSGPAFDVLAAEGVALSRRRRGSP